MLKPEEIARQVIDAALVEAGWEVQNPDRMNLYAATGVAIREFELGAEHGTADYLLFVDQQALGAVEAKKQGFTLSGVEVQSAKYGDEFPANVPAHARPLPFLYETTGIETWFTNRLDPSPRSRRVFAFHRPESLARWVKKYQQHVTGVAPPLRAGLQLMPPLVERGLWPAQVRAVQNLEVSLAQDRPRSLIQMATGSGKTFTAINSIYRLITYGGAERVLFLVDRANLGRQALKELQLFTAPDDGRKFAELYNVQLLTSNKIDPVARVVITTIQRLYSMLRGDTEFDSSLEEGSQFDTASALVQHAEVVTYSPSIPIETFDVIFTDECHRSIYNLWRQVLEYFDAYIIGLTATPSKQTIGFFNQNLVMEYSHQQAVVDCVNVDYLVYRIQTKITSSGSTVEAGLYVDKRDRLTRDRRWELLDEDLTYDADALDRSVYQWGRFGQSFARSGQSLLRHLSRPHRGAQDLDFCERRFPRR